LKDYPFFNLSNPIFGGNPGPVAFENEKSTPGNHSKIKERIDTGN
jgi:hypothetical protein